MSQTKFTPGPWRLESESRDGNGSDLLVTTADGAWNIADCRDNLNGLSDRAANPEANARLIAAAPNLYAVAARIVKIAAKPTASIAEWDAAFDAARAALKKAEEP